MKRRAIFVLIVVMLLAGATAFGFTRIQPEVITPDEVTAAWPVSHNSTGLVATPVDFAELGVSLKPLKINGYEPTIGLTRSGTMFVAGGGATVWRSTDRGETWKDVADHQFRTDQDPYLWVDPVTHRVFSAPNQQACSDVRWSDDVGTTWQPNIGPLQIKRPTPEGGCGDRGHDHQSLITGSPTKGVKLDGYANVVYYTYNDRTSTQEGGIHGGTWLSRSFNGGLTWEQTSSRIFPSDCQLGYSGVPAAAANGSLYVAKPGCTGVRLASSHDSGQTWNITNLDQYGMGGGTPTGQYVTYSTNPSTAVDKAGNAYALWAGDSGLLHFSRSVNGGASWSAPVNATPPGINVTAFSAMVAGDTGRVAIAYLGTNATPDQRGEAHFAPTDAQWHLYIGWVLDATGEDPTFTTWKATSNDDPVHVGPIWQAGAPPVGSAPNRQLRDFIGMAQHNGRVFVAYADSCNACKASASDASLWVAIANGGPSLTGLRLQPY